MLTQEEVKELLDYNPDTGVFTWKVSRGGQEAGSVAGRINLKGYRIIGISGKDYRAHRLAYLYMTGNWPKQQIDHKNGNRSDNRIDNLRDVSCRDNQNNCHTHRSGRLVGATWHKSNKKWQAQIVINGKHIGLGYFHTEQEAHEAYLTAKSLFISDSI